MLRRCSAKRATKSIRFPRWSATRTRSILRSCSRRRPAGHPKNTVVCRGLPMNKERIAPGSLRNKVILIFFAILIVPFLLIAFYTRDRAIEGITKANTSASQSFLIQARKGFEAYLSRLNDQMNDLVGN